MNPRTDDPAHAARALPALLSVTAAMAATAPCVSASADDDVSAVGAVRLLARPAVSQGVRR